jgi:hypothetical protein
MKNPMIFARIAKNLLSHWSQTPEIKKSGAPLRTA